VDCQAPLYIIGIDGGGTKTVGILTTLSGECLARIESGPSNYHVVGEAGTRAALADVIKKLCEKASVHLKHSSHFCLGIAGLGRPEDRKIVGRICDDFGLGKNWILTHDAHIAFVGGTEKQEGIIVISGTGAIAYGINADAKQARASGWGHLIGDEGSGYDIALKALQAVARSADGRDVPTELTPRILERLKLERPTELIHWVQAENRDTVAQLAEIVFDTAQTSDRAAKRIVDKAAAELALATKSVIEQLAPKDQFDIVLSGGNLVHQPTFADKLRRRLETLAPNASVMLPKHEPAYGAVLLAQMKL